MPVATRLIPIIPYAERADRLHAVLQRGASFDDAVDEAARAIIAQVRRDGDAALAALTERFDGVRPATLRVPAEALAAALDATDPELRAIIEEAAANIRRFHEQQRERSWFTEDGDGVVLGQRIVPMARVGLYVPGGTAAYPSSVLMNVIPAQVAGVTEIHLVSPPRADGSADAGLPHPLVLATAHLLGVEHVYAVGGAQAVAALAFGTDTIPRVDKIVGPGNAYVAAAKKLVYGTVAIDSIAGPSEIVVLADDTADARFVAADLLSQAEHDVRASAILVTPSAALAEAVQDEVERLVPEPRAAAPSSNGRSPTTPRASSPSRWARPSPSSTNSRRSTSKSSPPTRGRRWAASATPGRSSSAPPPPSPSATTSPGRTTSSRRAARRATPRRSACTTSSAGSR